MPRSITLEVFNDNVYAKICHCETQEFADLFKVVITKTLGCNNDATLDKIKE